MSDEETRPLLLSKAHSINDEDSSDSTSKTSNVSTVAPIGTSRSRAFVNKLLAFVTPANGKLLLVTVLLVIFGAIDTVAFKAFTNKIVNYLYFFHQIFCLLFVVIFMPIAYLRYFFTDSIKEDTFAVSKWKYAIMGGLDVLGTIMMMFGGAHTAGSLQTLLRQIPLLFTLVITFIFLKIRYHWAHYLGCVLILLGILLTVIMDMVNGQEVSRALWSVMFSLAGLPIAVSSVYKDHVLSEHQVDAFYFNGWISLFQFLFGVILWPIAMPLQGLPFDQTLINIREALQCWFYGMNSLPGDECQAHLWVVLFYFAVAIFNNILIVLVITHGSAAILWIATAMVVPLANIAFMLPGLVGAQLAVPFDPFNIIGMVLVLAGMIMFYKAPPPHSADAPPQAADSAGAADGAAAAAAADGGAGPAPASVSPGKSSGALAIAPPPSTSGSQTVAHSQHDMAFPHSRDL